MADYEALLANVTGRLADTSQSHVLAHLDSSNATHEEKLAFLNQINETPLEKLPSYLDGALEEEQRLKSPDPSAAGNITPFGGKVASTVTLNTAVARKVGLDAIKKGEVAALLLAGGQGTRLGFDGPKGVFDVGMASGRTLFRLIAERVAKLRQLSGGEKDVPLYIMTSPLNHEKTVTYFEENAYLGLPEDSVVFFPQGVLPCLTPEGKMLLEGPTNLAVAPDGNGGIYPAMVRHGVLSDMGKRGVKYIHAFAVDNALVKPADPTFVGYCIQQSADCGNKVLWKTSPDEKVGVVAEKDGKPCVVEYSDMSDEMAKETDATGKLVYGAGNICNHFYTLAFLRDTVVPNLGSMYHIARKKIPFYDANSQSVVKPASNNGIKLESFIFDVFPLSTSMAILDVKREDEFAPVKNAPGSPTDSPDTARVMMSDQAKRWLTSAGAKLVGDSGELCLCEVGPGTSYDGEGLEVWNGKELQCPFSI